MGFEGGRGGEILKEKRGLVVIGEKRIERGEIPLPLG